MNEQKGYVHIVLDSETERYKMCTRQCFDSHNKSIFCYGAGMHCLQKVQFLQCNGALVSIRTVSDQFLQQSVSLSGTVSR